MDHTPIPAFLLVSGIFFAAGIVKGMLGMGLPTLAMGLLGLLMPVPQAASLLTLPSLVTNVWQAVAGRPLRGLVAKLWRLQLGIVAGVVCAGLLPVQGDGIARLLLGACLLAYGISGLAGWRPRPIAERGQGVAALAAGVVTGVITGITGVFVIPAVPYLQTLQLDRKDMVQALGLCFSTSTIALAVLLAARGHLGFSGSLHSALALAPALAGMLVGQKLRDWMSEASFRRCFFGGMGLLGGWLVATC
ncbi:MAG TPA: sulfite exporter TauE/SafE family protein [Ramlibacter sp.]|uniref:sulfite exporter TauE/SafE family protein n=1 Tax=Ramlibacter sp. TaxID=1917967 RepID=UPI002ECFC8E9